MLTRTTPTSTSVQVRRGVRAAAAGTAALLALSLAAEPAVSATLAGSPGSASMAAGRAGKITTEFRYTFDRGETLKPRTIVRDVTGHRNNGKVFVSGGGRLRKVAGHPGKAARFPCRGCGRAMISAPDKRFLDPGRHPFWFGAAIKVRDDQALPGRDPNIMQKGVINQAGGRWKLELIGSHPQCTVTGRNGTVVVRSARRVDDAAWHTLQCRRQDGTISVIVDGTVDAAKAAPTGRLSNRAPVRIGSKNVGSAGDNDQFHGRIDSVFLKIDRR
jgi:hypothetical protein